MEEEEFELPVMFNSKELQFPAKLLKWGYGYKIEVDVGGLIIVFEPDEERNWRALVDPEMLEKDKRFSSALLQAIAMSIEDITT